MNKTLDHVLEDVGHDVERLHDAYADALAMPLGGPRDSLLAELRNRLGTWPHPDTPPAEVLAGAGTPGITVGAVLDTELARPARYQRPALIAALQERADAMGANATAHAFADANFKKQDRGGMFR